MVEEVIEEVEEHADILEYHDRRISKNENYRLQLQGALKFAGVVIGTSLSILSILIAAGVVG